jgi:hypothetical protein
MSPVAEALDRLVSSRMGDFVDSLIVFVNQKTEKQKLVVTRG